ncbi:GUN4 domain-containing protein [Pseudanabaenaceae cyanobacterium LEGE 13415]|nr:GUN4 domain-containing protein [Pseudanabaenaceae cyanobacterium LEGE 13415]
MQFKRHCFLIVLGLLISLCFSTHPISATEASPIQQDYTRLEAALNQRDFKTADSITYRLMLRVAGEKSSNAGAFNLTEWKNFSCSQLLKIDQLWSSATNGEQGFSVQSGLYQRSTARKAEQVYRTVGWMDGRGSYKPPNYQAPLPGSLPYKLAWQDGNEHRFEKFKACNL